MPECPLCGEQMEEEQKQTVIVRKCNSCGYTSVTPKPLPEQQ